MRRSRHTRVIRALQVESLFDVLVENNCEADSRGCALANAAVEITEPDHPARPVSSSTRLRCAAAFANLPVKCMPASRKRSAIR